MLAPAAVLAEVSTGDGVWAWQNPLPQGNPLNGGWFADADNGWFVGNDGTIMHTPDGGVSWDGQTSPTTFHLTSVCFPDALHGWAVGNYHSDLRWTYLPKAIITTSNGGKTWRTQETGISGIQNQMNTTLNCVRFADAEHGWAVGVYWHDMAYHALILATSDGGGHWVQQGPKSIGLELKAISCTDAMHAWAVGVNGTSSNVLVTDNGGATWTVQDSGCALGLYDVQFLDTQIGWAVGAAGKTARTVDGGATWTASDAGTIETLQDVAFSDATHGIACGANKAFRTVDGGATWTSQTPLPAGAARAGARARGARVWLVATVYRDWKPYDCSMLFTDDAGETWSPPASSVTTDLNDVRFVSPLSGLAVGDDGLILSTTNGGATWAKVESGVTEDLQDIEFVDTTIGWIVGGSTVLRTDDGGTTWQPHASPLAGLTRVTFVDALHGWAIGGNGVIRTETGGFDWSLTYLNDAHFLTGVTFVDALHGWIGGGRQTPVGSPSKYGVLFKTVDGGLTWDVQYRDDFALSDVCFTDTQHGWFTIGHPSIYRTIDGGETWLHIESDVEHSDWSELSQIEMLDRRHGWAVGTRGGILATSDGVHWVIENSGTRRDLRGVSFVDPANGWVVGDGGHHLKDPARSATPRTAP